LGYRTGAHREDIRDYKGETTVIRDYKGETTVIRDYNYTKIFNFTSFSLSSASLVLNFFCKIMNKQSWLNQILAFIFIYKKNVVLNKN
jgi:hypothetical protein